MNKGPVYPLRFTDDEGIVHTLDHPDEIGYDLEFIDDFDLHGQCEDADGDRVRVVVWALELLLLQTVPDDYDVARVTVVESPRPDGTTEWTESFAGRALRSVLRGADGSVRAVPGHWREADPAEVPHGRVDALTARDFNTLWMKARGAKR